MDINLKRAVYLHYSRLANPVCNIPECQDCGKQDLGWLLLYHPDGNGKEERRRYGGGFKYVKSLKHRGYPVHLQVLCFNCHGKREALRHKK